MGNRKKDPARVQLNSAHVEGQGTTTTETGNMKASSSRHKQKQS